MRNGSLPATTADGQRSFSGFVRIIFFAGKKSHERAALMRHMISNRPAQHRILRLERVEHREQRRLAGTFRRSLRLHARERSQMRRKYHANHGSVCTSTESTAGKSRTMAFQLSPASADA